METNSGFISVKEHDYPDGKFVLLTAKSKQHGMSTGVRMTYEELDKLYGEIENILQAHEWDKVKAGDDETTT